MTEHKLPSLFPWRWLAVLGVLFLLGLWFTIAIICDCVVMLVEREKRIWRGPAKGKT